MKYVKLDDVNKIIKSYLSKKSRVRDSIEHNLNYLPTLDLEPDLLPVVDSSSKVVEKSCESCKWVPAPSNQTYVKCCMCSNKYKNYWETK